MSQTRYLQKLGHSWYVRVKVPKSLQETVGNTHICRALHTRDLDEANRRKWKYVETFKAQLDRLRGYDMLTRDAHQFRIQLRKANSDKDYGMVNTLMDIASDEADRLYEKAGDKELVKESSPQT